MLDDGPFVVGLEDDGGDEPGDGGVVGEDPDDVGAALDLAVDALERVGRPDLAPVGLREPGVKARRSSVASLSMAAMSGKRSSSMWTTSPSCERTWAASG